MPDEPELDEELQEDDHALEEQPYLDESDEVEKQEPQRFSGIIGRRNPELPLG